MLRYKADIKTIIFLVIAGGLIVINWMQPEFNPWLWGWSMVMAVSVTTVVHNHNHLRIWKSKWLNYVTDFYLTALYGFPVFAWIPTHNKNHHKYNNREGDYTITYRFSERDNLFTALTYPPVSMYYQGIPIKKYLKTMWKRRKSRFFYSIAQYFVAFGIAITALLIDWQKGLLYVVAPQMFGLYVVHLFNYLQHVGADEESEWAHSRDMLAPIFNVLVFNNGYHTVHHNQPGLHWSECPEAHEEIKDKLNPRLVETNFFWFLLRRYILSPLFPSLRRGNLRVERIERERAQAMNQDVELAAAE